MSKKRILLLCALGVLLLAFGLFVWKLDIPNWQKLDIARITQPALSTRLLDRDGNLAQVLSSSENRVFQPLSALPDCVPEAFIAAEDVRFYEHHGVDIRRIFGALFHDIGTLSLSQGASTITQQLIKLTHLTGEKTLARKAQEAFLAMKLEKVMTKDEILEAYLNTVYFGGGAYGIEAASRSIFGIPARDLSAPQAALLAGLVKSPNHFSPLRNPDQAKARRDYVLTCMAERGSLTREELEEALREEPVYAGDSEKLPAFPWYADAVIREAMEKLDLTADEVLSGGYAIQTALNPSAQAAAQAVMESPEHYPEAAAQGACVVMEPGSGEILALVGGRSYEVRMGLNRALDSRRQLGSVVKPLSVYAAAVDRYGYVPTTLVYDRQRAYPGGYAPGNASGKYYGEVTLRTALSRSLNAATVDLADTIGIGNVCAYARQFALPLDEEDENLSFALGSMRRGATPVEICAAYCALADGGIVRAPHLIREIRDRFGNAVYRFSDQPSRAVSPETACILTDMLETAAGEGTAKALKDLGIPVAGKTGTAGLENGDTSDAWTAAYTPDAACVVWIGKDDNKGGGMASGVSGGGTACPACAEILRALPLTGERFPTPPGVRRLLVDRCALEQEHRAFLATSETPKEYVCEELFRADGEELSRSTIWEVPQAVDDLTISESEEGFPVLRFTARSPYAEYLLIRTCGEKTQIAKVVSGAPGEILTVADEETDPSVPAAYTVIPRHKQLQEAGKLLTGSESAPVEWNPGGWANRLTRLLSPKATEAPIETVGDSLFR